MESPVFLSMRFAKARLRTPGRSGGASNGAEPAAEAMELLRREAVVGGDRFGDLAQARCTGVALATSRPIDPQAVGGDIGCGMLAAGLDLDASSADEEDRVWSSDPRSSPAEGESPWTDGFGCLTPVPPRPVSISTTPRSRAGAPVVWETAISANHNHVSLERFGDGEFWVHRKGDSTRRSVRVPTERAAH